MAIQLSDADKKYLLSLKVEDISNNLLIEMFADRCEIQDGKVVKKPCRFEPHSEFFLEKGEYFNKEKVKTTAGQFIFNKFIVENNFKNILGYIAKPVDGGHLKKIEARLSSALNEDEITVEQFVDYLDRIQWLSMRFHESLTTSFTLNTLKPNKKVVETRDRLLKENKEAIESHDVIASVKIEKELLKLAEQELKGDPGLLLYESGARGSFGNNFKNISVMKGPVFDPNKGRFDTIQSNFMEGIKKEELPSYGTSVITGAYPKAIGTGTSGYFSKQILAALQGVVLDKKGSDCKTKKAYKIKVTSSNKYDLVDRFIVLDGKNVLVTNESIDRYVGKEVLLRSPLYCVGDKICNMCAGELYYKLGIENIGLTSSRVASTLLNLSMKKFHDATAKITEVNLNDMII